MSKVSKMKMPKMDKVLNDKNVLYVVFVLAILNLLGYLLTNNLEAIVFFLMVGFLSTYFSKNMIIVLIIAMISTSLFASTRPSTTEGMSTNSSRRSMIKASIPRDATPEEDPETTGEAMETLNSQEPRIDYANNLEKAYENLQSTIGKEGIKGLTEQTEGLLNQQKELMDNITNMQPFLKTAESFMNNLDLSGLEGIGNMLSKVTGKKNE
ncbi:hypothetical protein N8996_06925 [Candidatus Poseidonia alphae]|nr:hypothetical protein [Candidatus Poseidonia alphae]